MAWTSTDYMFRKTAGVHVRPQGKHDVNDDNFGPLVALQAGHQIFMDISRLTLVHSPCFSLLHVCCNVQYLDVSYNRLDASHIALIGEHCISLKSLVLAGMKFVNAVEDYRSLSQLQQLELLSLRQCEYLTSVTCLGKLQQLRSLDLGETAITSLAPLSGLSRLEELALDGCTRLEVESSINSISTQHLPNLRLINPQGTILASPDWKDALLDALHEDVCVESRARREIFVEAVINNDEITVRRLVGSGQDVNITVGPWGATVLADAWKSRGRAAMLQAPYFLCTHQDAELHPTPLHLAIYFNSQDCLAYLRFMNADARTRCWMGDVEEKSGSLVMDEAKVKAMLPKVPIYKMADFIEAVCDRGVHRLSTGMFAKKQTDWKKRCLELRVDIKVIYDHQFIKILEKRSIEAAKQAELDRIEAIRKAAEEAQILAQMAAKAAKDKEEKEAARKAIVYGGGVGPPTVAWATESKKSGNETKDFANDDAGVSIKEAPIASIDSTIESQSLSEPASKPEAAPEAKEEPRAEHLADAKEAEAEGKEEEEQEEEGDSAEPATKKKSGRKPLKMLPAIPTGFHWRGHSMVTKLNDAPLKYKSTRSLLDVQVLGKRSYWLEQCSVVLSERLKKEDAERAAYYRQIEEDAHAKADYERMKMQKGMKEYQPNDPVPVRKDEFLGLVKKDRDRKYVVRDDISEIDPGEPQSDDDKSM